MIAVAVGLAVLLGAQVSIGAAADGDCRCLLNGGQPGPGDCPCDVGQCYRACVDDLCPGTPQCTFECSVRCSCNDAPPGCSTHEDPGATPTAAPIPETYSVTACYSEVPNSSCSPFGAPYEPPSLYGPVPDGTMHTATPDPTHYSSYTFAHLVPGNYILGAGGCNPFGCRIDSAVTVADEDVFVVVKMVPPRRSPLFRVCASAAERPGGDPTPVQSAHLTLLPSGQVALWESPGVYCFHEVPPGDYLITTTAYDGAPSSCTINGCWQDTPVSVSDASVLDLFIEMLPLPTPTPSPCLGDGNADRQVTIEELVGAVAHALDGCP